MKKVTLKNYPYSCPAKNNGCDECEYFTYLTIQNGKVLGKCIQYNKVLCYLGDTALVILNVKEFERCT